MSGLDSTVSSHLPHVCGISVKFVHVPKLVCTVLWWAIVAGSIRESSSN